MLTNVVLLLLYKCREPLGKWIACNKPIHFIILHWIGFYCGMHRAKSPKWWWMTWISHEPMCTAILQFTLNQIQLICDLVIALPFYKAILSYVYIQFNWIYEAYATHAHSKYRTLNKFNEFDSVARLNSASILQTVLWCGRFLHEKLDLRTF